MAGLALTSLIQITDSRRALSRNASLPLWHTPCCPPWLTYYLGCLLGCLLACLLVCLLAC